MNIQSELHEVRDHFFNLSFRGALLHYDHHASILQIRTLGSRLLTPALQPPIVSASRLS